MPRGLSVAIGGVVVVNSCVNGGSGIINGGLGDLLLRSGGGSWEGMGFYSGCVRAIFLVMQVIQLVSGVTHLRWVVFLLVWIG